MFLKTRFYLMTVIILFITPWHFMAHWTYHSVRYGYMPFIESASLYMASVLLVIELVHEEVIIRSGH